jgi:hypothetical protein
MKKSEMKKIQFSFTLPRSAPISVSDAPRFAIRFHFRLNVTIWRENNGFMLLTSCYCRCRFTAGSP